MKKWLYESIPALLVFLTMTICLELAVQFSIVPGFLFPAPTSVIMTLYNDWGGFQRALFETLQGAVTGFSLSILIGVTLAILFSLSVFFHRAVMPFAVFFQTVPVIAVAPLLVIYFGFGMPTVVAASFIVSVFPVVAGTLMGLDSLELGKRDLFRLYGASPWQTLWKLKLPNAYMAIYAALKVSLGLAIIGAIAGEFVAGGGLGAMIDAARTQQRIDIVFGALLLLSMMGILGITLLKFLHKMVQGFRPYGLHLKD